MSFYAKTHRGALGCEIHPHGQRSILEETVKRVVHGLVEYDLYSWMFSQGRGKHHRRLGIEDVGACKIHHERRERRRPRKIETRVQARND